MNSKEAIKEVAKINEDHIQKRDVLPTYHQIIRYQRSILLIE